MIKGVNSIGFYDANTKRITVGDKRFYKSSRTGRYYPNLTMILKDGWPTPVHLKNWMKEQGAMADVKLREAGDFGSAVHDLIERNLKGETIHFIDNSIPDTYKFNVPEDVWKAFLRFVEFRKQIDDIYAIETIIISNLLEVGMTIDLVCRIAGETWIIDHKTSNAIGDDHFIQVAVAAHTWNEFFPTHPVTRVGLLHLKADTRGEDKKGKKLQGKGWQVVEPPKKHWVEYLQDFKLRHEIWKRINPDYKPLIYEIPCVVEGYKTKQIITGQFEQIQPDELGTNCTESEKEL